MALWEFTNLNKHGNFRTRIVYSKGALSLPTKGLGNTVFVKRFSYEYEHPLIGPGLFKSSVSGKLYLLPTWKEVHPKTTLSDIKWIKPVIKENKPEVETWTFKSGSSDSIYTVKKTGDTYKCNCPGYWRSFDRRCKHIKEVEK
jgi:hypothetical protein